MRKKDRRETVERKKENPDIIRGRKERLKGKRKKTGRRG